MSDMRTQFENTGYWLAKGLFGAAEAGALREHYMTMLADVAPKAENVLDSGDDDPLRKYPRMGQMHREDSASLNWLLDARIEACMLEMLGASPYAVQSMVYFKPPGARGQALHQDQYYLNAQPGTCIAAWMALDDCDTGNGCLQIVPGTHKLPLLCVEDADLDQSFTDVTVPLSDHMQPEPVIMQAGDVLFFNGQLIHGSLPNTTTDRFRRALIGHYIYAEAERVHEYYRPALRFDGSEVALGDSDRGGPCGVWVDHEGNPELEMIALPN
jgi:hypothetical protein